jgi:hypothetical protein
MKRTILILLVGAGSGRHALTLDPANAEAAQALQKLP